MTASKTETTKKEDIKIDPLVEKGLPVHLDCLQDAVIAIERIPIRMRVAAVSYLCELWIQDGLLLNYLTHGQIRKPRAESYFDPE